MCGGAVPWLSNKASLCCAYVIKEASICVDPTHPKWKPRGFTALTCVFGTFVTAVHVTLLLSQWLFSEFFFPAFSLQTSGKRRTLRYFLLLVRRGDWADSTWKLLNMGACGNRLVSESFSWVKMSLSWWPWVLKGWASRKYCTEVGKFCFLVWLCFFLLIFVYSDSFWKAGLASGTLQPTYLCVCVSLGSF